MVGYNYKEHLYERDHKRFPQKTFLGSENSHSDEAWKAVMDNDYICGQFIWTGIDYLGEAAGWPIHGSGAGVITTAGFPKPEYEERARMWQGKGCRAYKYGTDGSSEYDGGIICNIRGNKDISFVVWKQDTDSINSDICTSDKEIGYLYQILVRGKTGTEVKVRVEGDGICAGIDNGDLSDNTPFGKNSRKIYDGNLVVYAKRTGNGPVTVTLECD